MTAVDNRQHDETDWSDDMCDGIIFQQWSQNVVDGTYAHADAS